MKNPPTFADACIATAYDKRLMPLRSDPRYQHVKAVFEQIAFARKFVLDRSMSHYLADLSRTFWCGGLRKRLCMLENVRRMALAPHAVTWIEFDYPAYMERMAELEVRIVADGPDEKLPSKVGHLIRQHPGNASAFVATDFLEVDTDHGDRGIFTDLSVAWTTDDSPSQFPRTYYLGDRDAEIIVEMKGYRTAFANFVPTRPGLSIGKITQDFLHCKNLQPARDLWALLATINDLPLRSVQVRSGHGFVAQGRYRKFADHTVLHLTVPESKWRALVSRTVTRLRRRAHQVRGHLRRDWRHPLAALCEHDFDDQLICRGCGGRKIRVREHIKGDASLGFVTHDYVVHHERQE